MTQIRPAAVAGTFYPGSADELSAMVRRLLDDVGETDGPIPKAVIAPHAGYVYSGPVAARAYARLKPLRGKIKRVVLLGPCHRVPVQGIALSGAESFATPLGNVPIDQEACRAISGMRQVQIFDASHAEEHSLEVQLPFLQEALGPFQLVPLAVGSASPEDVAAVLERLWGGPETLIVVSTDLSHYLDYNTANRLDRETCRAIETFDYAKIGRDHACGRIPVSGLLDFAKRRDLSIETLDLRNSGDTAGPRDRVVGYGAWMLFDNTNQQEKPTNTEDASPQESPAYRHFARQTQAILEHHGETLLHTAAASIEFGLEYANPLPVDMSHYDAELQANGASFITLKKSGRLRGCIGSSQAYRPLITDTAENAFAAAFKDPRFEALQAHELDDLTLSISILSPSSPMAFEDEADLLSQIQPGQDGLILIEGKKRGLFLPVVWESLNKAEDFLAHLKSKAGLATNYWSDTLEVRRFITEQVSSNDLLDPSAIWRSRPLR
ncbi:MAG: AmmeMemoRadiSam system protein B [Rhodospirillaceae bacterium]|jgi:AmmeMemoRadiSam system protein B/AmmeMemoRadiSam system protein A